MLTVVEIGARDEKEPESPKVAEVAQSTHGVGKIEHGMGLPVIDEGSEFDSKVNQEEVITGITLTKKAEEVRAPEALADFPNVAEVAQSIHGVKTN